ncbi:expressed unknown protein [Seminavis robusta]|uniref:Apple domain-containing protein n=1 Tax=Seminavis robusta TaxID=568900 RepID=A0A9N8DBR1_9STRA|nr:expressed unknown protein [Seminavis robusta]|eukprot:Sro21_g015010.1 n/a (163) ;mRNA; r:164870-165358
MSPIKSLFVCLLMAPLTMAVVKPSQPMVDCGVPQVNVQCPTDGLFALDGETMESCQQKCAKTEGCAFYSFGKGACMGCAHDMDAEESNGVTLYQVDCLEMTQRVLQDNSTMDTMDNSTSPSADPMPSADMGNSTSSDGKSAANVAQYYLGSVVFMAVSAMMM